VIRIYLTPASRASLLLFPPALRRCTPRFQPPRCNIVALITATM
jgi:hypothetical protein